MRFWPWKSEKSKIVWLDLGDLGDLVNPDGPHEQWQDHGLGLLRTQRDAFLARLTNLLVTGGRDEKLAAISLARRLGVTAALEAALVGQVGSVDFRVASAAAGVLSREEGLLTPERGPPRLACRSSITARHRLRAALTGSDIAIQGDSPGADGPRRPDSCHSLSAVMSEDSAEPVQASP